MCTYKYLYLAIERGIESRSKLLVSLLIIARQTLKYIAPAWVKYLHTSSISREPERFALHECGESLRDLVQSTFSYVSMELFAIVPTGDVMKENRGTPACYSVYRALATDLSLRTTGQSCSHNPCIPPHRYFITLPSKHLNCEEENIGVLKS